jgi:hypothetical protein
MYRFAKQNWFLAAALVVVALINGAVAFVLTGAVTDALLTGEVSIARDHLQAAVKSEASQDLLFAEPRPSPALLSLARHIATLPGVARANIYSPDGFIRHSTEPNLVGLKFESNGELAEGFGGKLSAAFETIDPVRKPEHLALNRFAGRPFIEAYMPLAGEDGSTYAVVEFYKEPGALASEAQRLRQMILVSELLAGLALLMALYAVFARQSRR